MSEPVTTTTDKIVHRSGENDSRLVLTLVQGVGPRLYRLLLERFGSATEVLHARSEDLQQVRGIGKSLADVISAAHELVDVDAEFRRCEEHGIDLIFEDDDAYPEPLKQIPDPPPVLYCRGNLLPRDALAVAIVGTRHASHYGLRQAERLSGELSRAGCTIVSGLARGIDGAAHRAALATGGRTLAVLAGGVRGIYPAEHAKLAEQIIGQGALLSEFHSTSRVSPGVFPRRNRVISGLAIAVVVVEAGTRSGALSTARHAVEQNREVFAVPGPVDSRVSHGCHALLRQGAALAETAEDILEALGPLTQEVRTSENATIRRPAELQLNPQEMQILQSIDSEPTTIDQIVVRTSLPASRVLSTVSVLEMRHLITRVGGQRVCRR